MITVFTATYNREYIIKNLYQSLRRQTSKDFEWIVIDDGSIDNTEELFCKWEKEENDFPIKYRKVINGGKHRAINLGVNMAETDAFFCVDSDDYLIDNAIERVGEWFESICDNPQYAGISGLRGYSEDNPVGGWGGFSEDYVDATNLEREKHGLLGDKAEVYKTSLLKRYPFPEFENENFLTEAVVWNKIARDGYKLRWYNKIIYVCDYLEDGLTHCGYEKIMKNPRGYLAYLDVMSRIYGESYGSIRRFGLYFVLRGNKFEKETCKSKMQLTIQEADKLEEKYWHMIDEMNVYFVKYNIACIAIYGLGNVGNAFLSVSQYLRVKIEYAIDRKTYKKESIPIYSLDEELPEVDAVIITLKNYVINLEKDLQKVFKQVIYWKDISSGYWCE